MAKLPYDLLSKWPSLAHDIARIDQYKMPHQEAIETLATAASFMDHQRLVDLHKYSVVAYDSMQEALKAASLEGSNVAVYFKDLDLISRGAQIMAPNPADLFRDVGGDNWINAQKFAASAVNYGHVWSIAEAAYSAFNSAHRALFDLLQVDLASGKGWFSAVADSAFNSAIYASIARPFLGDIANDIFLVPGQASDKFEALLGRTLTSLDDPEVADPFGELKEFFREEIAKLKPSTSSYRGLALLYNTFMLIVSLLALAITYNSQEASREGNAWIIDHIKQIEKTNSGMARELRALKPAQPAAEYVVYRSALLMARPRRKGMVIGYLRPGQVVELVQRRHEWILVKYLDYGRGQEAGGWVLKKYLQKMEIKKGSSRELTQRFDKARREDVGPETR
jgi:hypothetical protein